MEQQKIIDELNYYRAQKITEKLYEQGMISFVEYDKLTELNRRSFAPMFADLLPKTLDKSIVWRCITRLTDKDKCRARTVNEDDLIAAFLAALNEMVGNSTEYLQRLKDNLETALKTANPESAEALAERMAELQQELIDRTERRERYDDLTEEILRLRELQAQTAMDDTAKKEHKKRIKELHTFIQSQPSEISEFDETLVKKLLEKVTVYEEYMEFQFKSGVTVSVEK